MPGVTHLADLLNLHREPETLQRVDVMVLCVITGFGRKKGYLLFRNKAGNVVRCPVKFG